MEKERRYCSKCGVELQETFRSPKPIGYSDFNGQPGYQVVLRCPNYRGWFGKGHDDRSFCEWSDSGYLQPWP